MHPLDGLLVAIGIQSIGNCLRPYSLISFLGVYFLFEQHIVCAKVWKIGVRVSCQYLL